MISLHLVFQRDKKNIVFEIADFTTLSAFYFILAFLDYKSESLGRYYSYIAIPVMIIFIVSKVIIWIMKKRKGS